MSTENRHHDRPDTEEFEKKLRSEIADFVSLPLPKSERRTLILLALAQQKTGVIDVEKHLLNQMIGLLEKYAFYYKIDHLSGITTRFIISSSTNGISQYETAFRERNMSSAQILTTPNGSAEFTERLFHQYAPELAQ